MDEARQALRPFERVIIFIGGLFLVGLVVQIGSFVSGQQSFFGFGAPVVCVSASPYQVHQLHGDRMHLPAIADGTSASVGTVNLCRSDPTTRQQLLDTMDEGASVVFGAGMLFLVWRLLRHARRDGVFVSAFARRLSALGIYVGLGAAAVGAIHYWAQHELGQSMAPGMDAGTVHFTFTPLLVALGLITLGRLMAATVPMREELDATV
jgi:hypothetical protein